VESEVSEYVLCVWMRFNMSEDILLEEHEVYNDREFIDKNGKVYPKNTKLIGKWGMKVSKQFVLEHIDELRINKVSWGYDRPDYKQKIKKETGLDI